MDLSDREEELLFHRRDSMGLKNTLEDDLSAKHITQNIAIATVKLTADVIQQRKKKHIKNFQKQMKDYQIAQEDENFLINMDRFTYNIGLAICFVTTALLFFPKIQYLSTFICLVNTSLIFTRFIRYKKMGWHYFFFDYCYYVNFYAIFVLMFFPHNLFLMKLGF